MSDPSLGRRDFLKMLGIGTAIGGMYAVPKVTSKTPHGVLVESPEEYGGFAVERMTDREYPYRIKPDLLKPMSEKRTVFSRNVWDPLRQDRPGLTENLRVINLVDGEGKIPNQTRLDYALMAASWTHAYSRGITYRWDGPFGAVRGESIPELPGTGLSINRWSE